MVQTWKHLLVPLNHGNDTIATKLDKLHITQIHRAT